MSEGNDSTRPLRVDPGDDATTRVEGSPSSGVTKDSPLGRSTDPVEAFRQPERRIWLMLAIALLSLLNLILLVAILATVTDDLQDQVVEVEGQRCLVVEEDDANVLYCQR